MRRIRTATDADCGTRRRACRLVPALAGIAATAALAFLAAPALAQTITLDLGQGGAAGTGLTERALQLVALITVLSIAPAALVMVTSFTRIVVVLSLLRSAIGAPTAPPNTVIVALALFLTAFIMAPTLRASYDAGVAPLLAGQIQPQEAFKPRRRPASRLHAQERAREGPRALPRSVPRPAPATPEATPLTSLIPAFMISELRRAFEIGFLLYIPFLIIDLVVASILMSMGMMMLPPVTVALPFKLIFFVLVDGWNLVAGSLVQSYGL